MCSSQRGQRFRGDCASLRKESELTCCREKGFASPAALVQSIFYIAFTRSDCGVTLEELEEFRRFRERMNARILSANNLGIKRFFALDSRAYEKGALGVKTKELLGLVASAVLRCDDCVTYHVVRCVQEHVSEAEFFEALNVALIAGGSITIPHLRRAVDRFDRCVEKQLKGQSVDL